MSASAILISTVLAVLFVLAIALVTGALALLASDSRSGEGQRSGTLEALRLLDRQWRVERLVYRHHRLFGLVVLAAGLFCVWQLGRAQPAELILGSASGSLLVLLLLIAQGFNLLIGLVIFLRPSLLKPLEAVGNRWHSLDSSIDRNRRGKRTTAAVLALVGLIVLVGSATLLIEQVSANLV